MSGLTQPLRALAKSVGRFRSILSNRERRQLVGILASNTVVAVLDLVSVIGVYRIVDRIVALSKADGGPQVSIGAVALPVGALVLRAVIGSVTSYLYAAWASRLLKRLLSRLFLSYLTRDFSALAVKTEGEALRDFQQVRFVTDGFSDPGFAISRELTSLIAVVVAVFLLDPGYALVLFGVLAIVVIGVSKGLGQWLGRLGALRNDSQASINNLVGEVIESARETRLYRAQEFWAQRFDRPATDLAHASAAFNFGLALPRYVFELAAVLAVSVAAGISWVFGQTSSELMPVIAGVGVAAVRTAPSAAVISASLQALAFYQPQVASAIHDISAADPEQMQRSDNDVPSVIKGSSVRLRGESERQNGESAPFLSVRGLQIRRGGLLAPKTPISFDCDSVGLIALVGESGSGKSSLIDGILGFADVACGRLELNGKESDGLISEPVAVGIVAQQPFVLSGTMRDNLCFGRCQDSDLTSSALIDVLVAVGLHERFPSDDDAHINANRLSGGQAYRLAIARAMLRRAQVLLLDEPTGALDDYSAESLVRLLLEESTQRLVIVATHDPRLVNSAAQIVRVT